ncbi:MAG: hypothetical protein SOX60_05065 [Prevotella sp.]|nr:hypothetical protein [Prevotella sp.]
MAEENTDMKQMAATVRQLVNQMIANGRADLALQAIGMSNLELLRLEAARAQLSRLLITSDYRFLLPDYGNKEVEMSPIHKALYLLFLNHPDGIESKHLSDHRDELLSIYMRVSSWLDIDKVYDVVDRLVDPLDNAFNEKCSRIKAAFAVIMDEYSAAYYAISGHKLRHISASSRVWYERKKIITLPRELVVWEEKR